MRKPSVGVHQRKRRVLILPQEILVSVGVVMVKRTVKADPTRYSRQSLQSYGARLTTEYTDIEYNCWRCKKPDVFTAEDQKHSFEVKKNYFWQRRSLCRECWMEANRIRKNLDAYQQRWAESKNTLRRDAGFLSGWLELLTKLEEYVAYKPDTARKNMLKKLLKENA